LEDSRISAKSIAEQLCISGERVASIIHEDLGMLVACFLPGRAKNLSSRLDLLIVIKNFARSSGATILFRLLCVPHAIRTVHYEFYVQMFLGNFLLNYISFYRDV
jgi:hypothetical protein